MKTREWTYLDRSDWARRGPWDREPDKLQWQDEATGLPCLIVRNTSGALCGYVGVASEHPWHGFDYASCTQPGARRPTEDELRADYAQKRAENKADYAQTIYAEGGFLWRHDLRKRRCPDGDWYCAHRVESLLDAHGGITFTDACQSHPDNPERGICHVPDTGEPADVWWFGFDCAHSGDYVPGMRGFTFGELGSYRDVDYVRRECAQLAQQLAAAVETATKAQEEREAKR